MRSVRVITGEGGVGIGTKVFDMNTGEQIGGIEEVGVPAFGRDDIVRVDLRIGLARLEIEGAARFQAIDPSDGTLKDVASITFTDGSEFKAD